MAVVGQQCGCVRAGRPAHAARGGPSPPFHKAFPPQALVDAPKPDNAAIAAWFDANRPEFAAMADPSVTAEEATMYAMSAAQYIEARKAGELTCEAYTRALVKRMLHYKELNCFMATTYGLTDKIIAQAVALDAKAAGPGGVSSIGPLYGLPVPVKGTAATIDFPSSVGVGVLDGYTAKQDSALVVKLKAAHAVIMGKTNVPEFAASCESAAIAPADCRP